MGNEKYMPQVVTDLEMVIGGQLEQLLPQVDEIPKEFFEVDNVWNEQLLKWHFQGARHFVITPKEDIDPNLSLRHISAILNSFEVKDELKIAGCAFLASEYFEEFLIIE